MRRRHVLAIAGALMVFISLLGLADNSLGGLISTDKSYNLFLLVVGLMSFGAADLGAEFSRWFDMLLTLVMVILLVNSFGAWLVAGSTPLGNLFFNGALVLILVTRLDFPALA
jgi:hypothetical protein